MAAVAWRANLASADADAERAHASKCHSLEARIEDDTKHFAEVEHASSADPQDAAFLLNERYRLKQQQVEHTSEWRALGCASETK